MASKTFSKEWGIKAVPQGTSIHDYLASLSESDKNKLNKAVEELLQEAKALSQTAVDKAIENGTFQKFTALLAKKGDLNREDIDTIAASAQAKGLFSIPMPEWLTGKPAKNTLAKLKKGEIVTIESLVEKEIASQRQSALKLNVPVAQANSSIDLASMQKSCDELLK